MIHNRNLHVMIPSRDRVILTQKAIESIRDNSGIFNNINIYIFDNNSDLEEDRLNIFQELLKTKKINYYSYDTSESTSNCFAKAILFRRWIEMLNINRDIIHMKAPQKRNEKDYYLLMDNDFIVGKEWDKYFVSVADNINTREQDIHFVVQSPGGVPGRSRDTGVTYKMTNIFTGKSFETLCTNGGGASGFWFMNHDMLNKLKWGLNELQLTYGISKRHDSITWNMIQRKIGRDRKYTAGIIIKNMDPLCIHLGGQSGSICNQLMNKRYRNEIKQGIKNSEIELFGHLSHQEIFEKYKEKCKGW